MDTQTVEDVEDFPLITFNSLTSLLREEQKKTNILQVLPEKFYQGFQNFIAEKEKEVIKFTQEKETAKAFKEQKIIMGSRNKMAEILNLRMIKISTVAVKNAVFQDEEFSTENMLADELEFYEKVLNDCSKTVSLIK